MTLLGDPNMRVYERQQLPRKGLQKFGQDDCGTEFHNRIERRNMHDFEDAARLNI